MKRFRLLFIPVVLFSLALPARGAEVLVLLEGGHSAEADVRAFGAWIEEEHPAVTSVAFSADLSPNVLDSATSLSQEQRNLLENYDLILMPRRGAGVSGDYGSTDWNAVATPLLNMNPFTYRDGNWGWGPPDTGTPTQPALRDLFVADATGPLFEGLEISGGTVSMYHWPDGTMQFQADSSIFTGNVHGWTDVKEWGSNLQFPWIITWEGTEAAFYEGGAEAPGGRRTLFLSPMGNPVDALTPRGSHLVLRAISVTITGEADPDLTAPTPLEQQQARYRERQADVLLDIASRYDPDYTGYLTGHRRNFGVHSTYLVAALEVNRRGIGEGVTISEAMPRIEEMLQHARDNLDDWTDMPLNPGKRMAAYTFPYIYHRWYDELSDTARGDIEWLMSDSPWKDHVVHWLVNGSVYAGKLMVGEKLGYDSDLWQSAFEELEGVYERTMTTGGLELNSPIYSSYHFAPLALLTQIEHEEARNMARTLLDYTLIVSGHLYIPGGDGFVGVPRMRQREGVYAGSARLPQHYHLFFGEPATNFASNFSPQMITAAADYMPPNIVESLFTDKPSGGYEFWAFTDSPFGTGRMGAAKSYTLIPGDNRRVSPWHTVMMPDGNGLIGTAYGHRGFTHHISMGAWVRDAESNYHGIYHIHPVVEGDTYDNGNGLVGFEPPVDNPDDFQGEGYDYERFLWGRTLLSIWDPTLDRKDDDVVRTYQDTRARIPNLENFGGEMIEHEGWYVGRMGTVYMAYLPLGEIDLQETRGGGDWFYVRLNGRSGCIIEMATTDDFDSVQEYANDLAARHLAFDSSLEDFHVVFDARAPQTGELTRLRLEYEPESRFVDGLAITMEDLNRGFLDSPWADWSTDRRVLNLEREGYVGVRYDIATATIGDPPDTDILMLVEGGHSNEANVRAFGDWIRSEWPGEYWVDYSADLAPDVLDSASTLTQEQRELLESYDLVIMPRHGVGGSGNFATADWNEIATPILNMNPFTYSQDRWGWVPAGTETPTEEMERLVVADAANPLFEGVDTSDGNVTMYTAPEVNMHAQVPSKVFAGTVAGWTDQTADGGNLEHPWVVGWDGGEESFYSIDGAPGEQAPGGPRLLFLGENPVQVPEVYTPEGLQILINAIDHLIAAGANGSLPAGYDAWRETHFEGADLDDDSVSGPAAAPLGDGIANLVKFALGVSPYESAREFLPFVSVEEVADAPEPGEYLVLRVIHREDLAGIEVHVDLSRDLIDWSEKAVFLGEEPIGDGLVEARYRDTKPFSEKERGYLRMRLELE